VRQKKIASLLASVWQASCPIHQRHLFRFAGGAVMNAKNISSGLLSATLGLLLAASVALSACSGEPLTTREEGTIGGAAVGAGTGALVGAAVGAPGAGAAIGGAAGGVAGYAIGNQIQNEQDRHGDY
jgi:hypothetical protein